MKLFNTSSCRILLTFSLCLLFVGCSNQTPLKNLQIPIIPEENQTPSEELNLDSNIIQAGIMEWYPFTASDLPKNGLLTAIASAALKEEGYHLETEIMPWPRAFEMAKEGKFDALIGASKSEERLQWFSYPNELWLLEAIFYTKSGNDTAFTSIENLAPSVIGSLTGSFLVSILEDIDGITIETTATLDQNILKLAEGRLDYLIEYSVPIEYLLSTSLSDYTSAISPLSPPAFTNPVYIVFSKQNPRYEEYTEALNRGLDKIKVNGIFDEILLLYNMK